MGFDIFDLQVENLVKQSSTALAKIGQYDPEDLPPEFKPTINFVHKVSKLFGDIKADVMGFVNVSFLVYHKMLGLHVLQ